MVGRRTKCLDAAPDAGRRQFVVAVVVVIVAALPQAAVPCERARRARGVRERAARRLSKLRIRVVGVLQDV